MNKNRPSLDVSDASIAGRAAVIYCRIASVTQANPEIELDAQEARCLTYAEQRGLAVLRVFKEHDSGAAPDRSVLSEMLSFIKERSESSVIVVLDDISRLARGLTQYHEIRAAIADAGGVVESPALGIETNTISRLLENVLVSFAARSATEETTLP